MQPAKLHERPWIASLAAESAPSGPRGVPQELEGAEDAAGQASRAAMDRKVRSLVRESFFHQSGGLAAESAPSGPRFVLSILAGSCWEER